MKLKPINFKPWQMGLLIGWGLLMTWLTYIVGMISISYAGQCGRLMPFASKPRPCAFEEYFWESVSFTLKIIAFEWWPAILSWMFFTGLLGWAVGRYRKTKSGN